MQIKEDNQLNLLTLNFIYCESLSNLEKKAGKDCF